MKAYQVLALVLLAVLALGTVAVAQSPRPLVQNGGFEEGQGNVPAGWRPSTDATDKLSFTWEPNGGMDNSRCVSIEAKDFTDASWMQTLKLKPRTAYLMYAMVKAENVENGQDKIVGVNIGVNGVWGCYSDPSKSFGTFGWTRFYIDFATGEEGKADINCRLGHWYNVSKGKVWFDNVQVIENPFFHRYEGKHIYMLLPDDAMSCISREHLDRWIAHLDATYEAMYDLVGREPFGGAKIGFYPVTWYPGGAAVAGNPIYWIRIAVRTALIYGDQRDDWGFAHLHEMGHDFDEDGAWNFNGEFWANIKLYYAIETLNGRLGDYVGAEHINYWKDQYLKDWQNSDPAKRGVGHDGLQYLTILMRQKTGWEPFKKTFRWFHSLPEEKRSMTPWQRFKLFYDKLEEFSGVDVWSYFTPEELEKLKERYPDK